MRPHLEFGNFPWSPRVEKGRNLIEGVQRRATKMVPESKELEYEERLKRMDSPSLRYSKARGVMINTYKYTHSKYTVNIDLLIRNEDSVQHSDQLPPYFRELPETTRVQQDSTFTVLEVLIHGTLYQRIIINAPTLIIIIIIIIFI